jgi:hypothetical protein
MLIHMTPGEVKGLQAIALAHGGSLTINPETGLPEAGFLKSLLPMIAGAALMMIPGMQPLGAAALTGLGSTGIGLAKGKGLGDALGSGLKAGLGAYGGASLTGGVQAAMADTTSIAGRGTMVSPNVSKAMNAQIGKEAGRHSLSPAVQQALSTTTGDIASPLTKFTTGFTGAAREGLPSGGFLSKAAPYAAGVGVLSGLGAFNQPKAQNFPGLPPDRTAEYIAAYQPQYQRDVVFRGQNAPMEDTSEFQYFRPRASLSDTLRGLTAAQGGEIGMKDGDFVLDARTVSEIGNGSSNAGKEILSRMGGIPVEGAGDGVSDSVRANIGGVQEARVARDEVIIPRNQVQEMGGSQRLYDLMKQAHEARKTADRGEDTGLARGLMPV